MTLKQHNRLMDVCLWMGIGFAVGAIIFNSALCFFGLVTCAFIPSVRMFYQFYIFRKHMKTYEEMTKSENIEARVKELFEEAFAKVDAIEGECVRIE